MFPDHPIRVSCIVGARPNFMKMAPILAAMNDHGGFEARLIHTGQHYDVEMNAVFFEQLGMPNPDTNLNIGSGTQTRQTARIMEGLEQDFITHSPELVLVVGDVNSTLAAALVAAKLGIPLAHVEAGLRSFDNTMPEEINRLVTDRLSSFLFTTEKDAVARLAHEGTDPDTVFFVGNVMIDTLLANLERATPVRESVAKYGASTEVLNHMAQGYALATLHRPSNVDDAVQLDSLLRALRELADILPVIFPLHPRTRTQIETSGLSHRLDHINFVTCNPFSYFEMLGATKSARLVITDSGGLQEETTALGIPCLTVRENSERPITISQGTNTLVGASADALRIAIKNQLSGNGKRGRTPDLWDGRTAKRIVSILASNLKGHRFAIPCPPSGVENSGYFVDAS